MKKAKFLLITMLCLFIAQPTFSQAYTSNQIDSIVKKAMSIGPNAGVAVVVLKDNKIVHLKGYGVTSNNTKEKVNKNTLFAIASNSKAFTTTALAMLVDQGKLNWLDKVVDYIPEFKMYDSYVTENFNIQDLLTHRSGLGLGAGDLMFFPDGSDFNIKDVLNSFQYQKPTSAFRTKYDYDNLLYVVAGEVVARVSGMSWAKFVETNIMKPLGMQRSAGVYQRLKDKSNVAFPHSAENGKLNQLEHYIKNDESLGAAGGIYTSVNDLSKWLIMHLNNGKYGNDFSKTMISKKSHDELWKPHTNIGFNVNPKPPYKTHFNAYGLGWRISDKGGYLTIEHTGGLPGMLSRTILIPELNVGIVVLTNTAPGGNSFWTIPNEIMDAYLGIKKTDWISLMEKNLQKNAAQSDAVTKAVWNTVAKANSNHIKHSDYIGTYKDNWFGKIKIYEKNNKLWFASVRSPKLTGEMSFYKANTFAIKWNYQDMPADALAMFTLDEEGKAVRIKMRGISPNIDFSFDFQDLDLKRVKK
ncbi:Protein flp [Polaribacter huanghezhanensis]|uniref:serine hydrolase n=1 Tax=Polaribacter huanghezhanensis TaxID=1354726 RepID=UPI00264834EF|nr:serine hydrolase [Polaribacter huanghezhanensis]WKD86975.1 Protein flp [Polaribacter huanghezhanensis]